MSLAEFGYQKVENLLSATRTEEIANQCMKLIWTSARSHSDPEKMQYTDNTRAVYGDIFTDELMLELTPKIEHYFECKLLPTYSYMRFYPKGSGMIKHKDRAACQHSVSLCLKFDYSNLNECDYSWPLYCDGRPLSCQLGDAVLYNGCDVLHWREPLEGLFQLQLFLHYVRRDHPRAETLYLDGRSKVGTPPVNRKTYQL